jgi:hypothetical protein
METEQVYVVVKKKENIAFCTIDLLKASSLLGIHKNTFRNRLKRTKNYFENHELIIATAILYRSNRGRIPFADKKAKSKLNKNEY